MLAPPTAEESETKLKLWTQYSDADGGVLENVIGYQPGEKPQRTLVLIKPENFRFPSGRPGNVIDFFSRTGLFIIAIKLHRMSVAQALEFYGPVREVLRSKLKEVFAGKAKAALEKEFGFRIPPKRNSNWAKSSARSSATVNSKTSSSSCRADAPSDAPREGVGETGQRENASHWSTKASKPCARSATFSALPILRRLRRDPSGASLARRSWSTPRMPATR